MKLLSIENYEDHDLVFVEDSDGDVFSAVLYDDEYFVHKIFDHTKEQVVNFKSYLHAIISKFVMDQYEPVE